MGIRNSSLTRVRPVFNWLYSKDPTGESWLVPLMRLATLSDRIPPNFRPGPLSMPPQFEQSVEPPRRFLRFLLENPARLTPPPEGVWATWNPETQAKRRALLARNPQIQAQGLHCLTSVRSLAQRPWWRLEGCTSVDCALFTQNTLLFIEGKRTEVAPSGQVTWWQGRNQIIRNVECALELAAKDGVANAYVLLVLEDDLCTPGSDRARHAEAVSTSECIAQSLPHLGSEEREAMMAHYLGWTTWQSIVREFRVDAGALLDTV